jgi:hypothetical protein
MAFSVGDVEYEDPHHCLREVLQMVRTGVFPGRYIADMQGLISDALRRLKTEQRRHPGLFDEVERLRLLTLEAEVYQENGEFYAASNTLEPVWTSLKRRLDGWSKLCPMEPTGNAALCRQKIWAALNYVFFKYYRLEGKQRLALQYFLRLEKVIRDELQTDIYEPYGTRALCHYYAGICYNVLGSTEVERHLLEAQKDTYARANRELSGQTIVAAERNSEIVYKNVFSARILSGLARLALQQGQLVRAEHLLYAAQSLLMGTQQIALQRFIAVYLCTVIRRRAAYTEPAYQNSLDELESYFQMYRQGKDPTGQLRCASELARGYLDWAEFNDTERTRLLGKAEHWLNRIPKDAPIAAENLRSELLRTRLHLLRGDVEVALDVLLEPEEIIEGDLSLECGIELSLMEALCCLHLTPPGIQKAQIHIEKGLETIRRRRNAIDKSEWRSEPALEAECYLLLAKTKLMIGNFDAAQKHLDEWKILRQFVDNHYLRHLGGVLQDEVNRKGPRFERMFDAYDPVTGRMNKTIVECLDDYEAWLRSALASHGITKKKDLAKFYGKHPANVDRKPKQK